MDSVFLPVILMSFLVVSSSRFGIKEWEEVVVAREGNPITLACTDPAVRGAVAINWMLKSPGVDDWKLVLSASESKEFSGGASKPSMRLADPSFQDTRVYSLYFIPTMDDCGLYSCLIKQQEKKLREKIILLAILTVTVLPAPPIPQYGTLQLLARVNPNSAITKITWTAPDGTSMKSEKKPKTGTVAKRPQVQNNDSGVYVCMVHALGNNDFPFNVTVHVDAGNVASFNNITHDNAITTVNQAGTAIPLTCNDVRGDYVKVWWQNLYTKKKETKQLYIYDRWRGSFNLFVTSPKIQLAGPPYNAEAGSFSFLLTTGAKEGGVYICEVFLDDCVYSRRTEIIVMEVKTSRSPSKMDLRCLYSKSREVQSAIWNYHNKSRQLSMFSNEPGSITTTLPLPITPDTAGDYTCTLQLKNGQTVWAMQTVMAESDGVTTPSQLPFLSALLLLVPLVAAAVGVLLWRQKHISGRGIEQTLSVHSGETENVYENPEDIRQAPPQSSVYMDLKPRGEDDVYKELERC